MIDILFAATVQAPTVAPLTLYAEARGIAENAGEALWPGFANAPFQIILIEGELEYLVCGEGPGEGFEPAGLDPATGCEIRRRDRQFNPGFLASFPAADFIPTIVVGTSEATGLTPDGWRIVLLHEHFHQMQDSRPGAYQAVLALDLHGGDQTGMWMLDYPFPYQDEAVSNAHRRVADAALLALRANDAEFERKFLTYIAARTQFLSALDEADMRYWEFQLWREGVARWTELEIARRAGLHAEADRQWDRLIDDLESVTLSGWQRTAVYASGAADAELLERAGINWRDRYWSEPYALGPYFQP